MVVIFRGGTPVPHRHGVPNDKEEMQMFTKEEVIAILNDMKKQTDHCVGFIVGMVTKGWVHHMIDEKIQEVMKDIHLPSDEITGGI